MPEVSIILPTYNRSHTIKNSIQSLLEQRYQDFEVIVVDDGSTDNTQAVVNELIENDSRIRYIKKPKRSGANAARNMGIQKANGKYIAFQDSDDWWFPEKLSLQIIAIQQTGVSVVFTAFWRIIEKKQIYIPKKYRNIKENVKLWNKELLEGNFISTQTLLVEKALLYETGLFDESLPRLQDWELVLRLSKKTPFLFLDKPLINVHIGKDSITCNRILYRKSMEIILKKHEKDFRAYPPAQAIQYLNLAMDAIKGKEFNFFLLYILKILKIGMTPLLNVAVKILSK